MVAAHIWVNWDYISYSFVLWVWCNGVWVCPYCISLFDILFIICSVSCEGRTVMGRSHSLHGTGGDSLVLVIEYWHLCQRMGAIFIFLSLDPYFPFISDTTYPYHSRPKEYSKIVHQRNRAQNIEKDNA